MWNVDELLIISDLHLAAERDVGLFQSDAELADCLRWILTETRDSLTVLAGDILDFLILSNGNTKANFNHLDNRARGIIEHHPEVFDALSRLAQSPQHRLVIMGGNHDPELVFPAVQEVVEGRLGVKFINPTIRWLVQGEALRLNIGNAVVMIEHGNNLDPWNRIDHASLQSALSLACRNFSEPSEYQPPRGSRLALEVINELRNRYHWIDCLKPETEAVLPLLWYFTSGMQQNLLFNLADDYLSKKTFAFNERISNSRKPERLYMGEKEAENSEKDKAFKEWVGSAYEQHELRSGNNGKQDKLIKQLRLVSAQDTFFDLEKPDDIVRYLRPTFDCGTDLVIHGHTHSAKAHEVEGGFYINTGTWGQLLHLPKSYEGDEVWQGFLDLLRTNDIERFRRPTLARVQCREKQGVTTAALLEWQQSGPKTLVARRLSDRQTGWRKEE